MISLVSVVRPSDDEAAGKTSDTVRHLLKHPACIQSKLVKHSLFFVVPPVTGGRFTSGPIVFAFDLILQEGWEVVLMNAT